MWFLARKGGFGLSDGVWRRIAGLDGNLFFSLILDLGLAISLLPFKTSEQTSSSSAIYQSKLGYPIHHVRQHHEIWIRPPWRMELHLLLYLPMTPQHTCTVSGSILHSLHFLPSGSSRVFISNTMPHSMRSAMYK